MWGDIKQGKWRGLFKKLFGGWVSHMGFLNMALLAVIAGLGGGLCALIFVKSIDFLSNLWLGQPKLDPDQLLSLAALAQHLGNNHYGVPRFVLILAVPILCGLAVGLIYHYLISARRPLGISDLQDGDIASLKASLINAGAAIISVGGGASAGREAPAVHLAYGVGSWLTQKLGGLASNNKRQARIFALSMVAATVAASFNAPLAGAFFALEVLLSSFALANFAPVVIASVTGTLFSRAFIGGGLSFGLESQKITSLWEFPAFAMLGFICGIVGVILVYLIVTRQQILGQFWGDRLNLPRWALPGFGGLILGGIGLIFPFALGIGYDFTMQILTVTETWRDHFGLIYLVLILLLVIMAKSFAVLVSFASGFGGGIFSPAMVLGALIGALFGIIAASLFPALASSPNAYAVIGMGALAGAILGAPISTIFIMFEMTGDYRLTLAVMVATVIASQTMHHFGWFLVKRRAGADEAPLRQGDDEVIFSLFAWQRVLRRLATSDKQA